MRWLDASPRRAPPRGHKTLILCAACTSSQSPPTAATPFRARGAKCHLVKSGLEVIPHFHRATLPASVDCELLHLIAFKPDRHPLSCLPWPSILLRACA